MSDKKCPNCGYELDSWNDCVSVNNILECPECEEHFELKAVTLNQPQLTIPKSIADELDLHEINWQDGDLVFRVCNALPCKVEDWFDSDYNSNVAMAYLAGKALGVDLVKVVEG